MKIMKWLKAHPATLKDVAVTTCLLGASAGIVFGVSSATFKVNYMDLNNPEARLLAANSANYYGEKINSAWNMNETDSIEGVEPVTTNDLTVGDGLAWWQKIHGSDSTPPWVKVASGNPTAEEGEELTDSQITVRHDAVAIVIDGATHTTMDRSFNQSLYEGFVDYIKNKQQETYDPENLNDCVHKNTAISYKPSQDNTTEFVNMYLSAMEHHTVLGLAGFNHSTPLNSLMFHEEGGQGGKLKGLAVTSNAATTKESNESIFILLDANVSNNQNVASVQFRADQPGFLAALSTCQYFYNNLDIYHDHYQDLSVAAFGGVMIPTVLIYMGGFQRGVEFFNYATLQNILYYGAKYYYDGENPPQYYEHYLDDFKNLINHSKYKDDLTKEKVESSAVFEEEWRQKLYDEYSIKMIRLGDVGTHFSGTFAPGDAIGITKQYLNRGASAIIAVAGPQSLDAAQEIRNQNSKCIVIGVDTAMENSDYQRFHNGCDESSRTEPNTNDKFMDQTVAPDNSRPENVNGIIKFSAIKDIKNVSKKITRLSLQGKAWDVSQDPTEKAPHNTKAICGPGFQTCGNIINGLISISWDGFYPLIQALQCCDFLADGHINPLQSAWKAAALSYLTEDVEVGEVSEEYKNLCKDIDNLKTFDKTSEKGKILHENYLHTTKILGRMLQSTIVPFDHTMTLKSTDTGWTVLGEHEIAPLTILDWLASNMYMTC